MILALSDPLTALGPAPELAQLAALFLPPAEAVFGKALHQNWLELSSVSEALARLALRLARDRATKVTAAEQEVLLQVPAGCGPIQIAAAEAAAEALGRLGVTWRVPRKRTLAALEAARLAAAARLDATFSASERALFEAARTNDAGAVVTLLGVDVELRTFDQQWPDTPAGDTPLIQACKAGAASAALALIAGGADPDARNAFGQTGLLWSVREGLRDVLDACLDTGADPNSADDSGVTPLIAAAGEGASEIVDRLLKAGASRHHRTRLGTTASERAALRGHHALSQLLT